MVFEQIEKLKRDLTDKFVVVDDSRPELVRFKNLTGTVRTVNMNGRALVEFDGFLNIGWFDIDPDFLQIIDRPLEKPEPTKTEKKPAAKAAEPAKPAAKPAKPAAPGGMSAADILAAARGGSAAKPEKKAESKPPPAAMSVEDILAAAHGAAAPAKSQAAEAAASPAAAEPEPEPASETEPATSEEPVADSSAATSPPAGDLPTDVEGILAFCRERDG